MSRFSTLLTVFVSLTVTSLAHACDTPVYRYAMYRWESSPYEFYLFHEADLSEADAQVVTAFEEIESRMVPRTNAVLIPVDLREENALKRLPPDVLRHWEQRQASAENSLPAYLTVSPLGGLVSWKPLTTDTIASMLHSPARKQIAQQLAEAKAGVMLVLTGKDPLANKAAEKEVQGLAKQLEEGEVTLYRSPTQPLNSPDGEGKPDDSPQIGVVTVNRNDPAEQWLVGALLAVEGDLPQIDKPMVFPIYGRGRALPPFVGAGITAGNLTDAVSFITGACSCTVKDQNPGVDLLITYDWATAADRLKEKFGSEEGNEKFGGDNLYPQLIIPGETGGQEKQAAADPDDTAADAVESDGGEPLSGEGSGEREAEVEGEQVAGVESEAIGADQQGTSEGKSLAMHSSHEEAEHSADESHDLSHANMSTVDQSYDMFWIIGLGIGFGVLLLGAGTFFVLRND